MAGSDLNPLTQDRELIVLPLRCCFCWPGFDLIKIFTRTFLKAILFINTSNIALHCYENILLTKMSKFMPKSIMRLTLGVEHLSLYVQYLGPYFQYLGPYFQYLGPYFQYLGLYVQYLSLYNNELKSTLSWTNPRSWFTTVVPRLLIRYLKFWVSGVTIFGWAIQLVSRLLVSNHLADSGWQGYLPVIWPIDIGLTCKVWLFSCGYVDVTVTWMTNQSFPPLTKCLSAKWFLTKRRGTIETVGSPSFRWFKNGEKSFSALQVFDC